ncbi:MAG: LytR/AlgR family response regulator transcription factor [Akkermansiaceae bacterium]
MTVLIIEDNEIEMENLITLLGSVADYQIVGGADTIKEGASLANKLRPDIIFLDIQLECENSLEHLDLLDYHPTIICSTLFTDHALQAFEVGVTDYLTKPITREKLDRALNRLPKKGSQSKEIELDKQSDGMGTLLLRNGTKTEKVCIESIILVTADRDYSTVRDEKKSLFTSSRRMREWGEILPSKHFVTLDRSTIVNKKHITSYTRLGAKRVAKVTFINGETHKIGSTALRRLKAAIEV